MASARPLRDVFADLVGAPGTTGDPAALLREHGHPGLPDDLVAEAVVSYADTAPVEVAEHLAPYVTAHSVVGADPEAGDEPAAGWLDLLGTAPDVAGDDAADLDGLAPERGGFDAATDLDPDPGLEFGAGAGSGFVTEPGADEHDDEAGWAPVVPEPDLTAEEPDLTVEVVDLTAEESGGDEGEPDDEPLD